MKSRQILLLTYILFCACSPSPAKKADDIANQNAKRVPADSLKTSGKTDSVVSSPDSFPSIEVPPMNRPPFGLARIEKDIAKIETIEDSTESDYYTYAVDSLLYSQYSLAERFTYNMIHFEVSSQNCSIFPEHSDPSHRIYGQLPDFSGDHSWSDRQRAFFSRNRDTVMGLIRTVAENQHLVGANFKSVIVENHFTELIPWLIRFYEKESKDNNILTALLLLMKDGHYKPFTKSASFRKLYGPDSEEYSAYLDYNSANETLIIKRATEFYNASPAK